jgi:hypothetical protein
VDPGCLPWIQDPDFYPSQIPDPGSWILISDPTMATKEEGENVLSFFVATNITKESYFIFER